jgi:hypothetical protein
VQHAATTELVLPAPRAAYVPLSFAPGEAYQFDWSHEVVLLNGVTVMVKAAHVRLCHSRMLFVRCYPRETQERAEERTAALVLLAVMVLIAAVWQATGLGIARVHMVLSSIDLERPPNEENSARGETRK